MGKLQEGHLNRVSPFVENMVTTLCPLSESGREESAFDELGVSEKPTLEKFAYNGLCKGRQILSWRKDTLERDIPNLKQYLDSGILVVEEGIVKGNLRSIQDETEKDKSPRKEKKAKKSKKEATKVDQTNKSIQDVSGATASSLHQGHAAGEGLSETLKGERSDPYDTEEPMSRRKRLLKRFTPKIFMKRKPVHNEGRQETVASVRAEELLANEEQDDRGPDTRASAASPSSESESTPSESESELSESHQTSSGPTAKDFPLEVKFLHKVMQEWFASKHFSSILWKSWTENTHRELLGNVLPQISPTDLHYILRFTSYLCPPSCYLIMDFLLKNHSTAEGFIPEYILNCVCLCFAEYNGIMGLCMKDIVSTVCAEIIPIRSDDSRLIQQSKVALMRFAASVGILIKGVHLIDVVSEVGEKSLTFNSGVLFDVFNMIQVIEMSRWDQHLEGKDYENILKLVLCSNSIRKARLHFPSPPPMVDKEALEDVVVYDKTVEWVIGPRLIQTLNMKTGIWEVAFGMKDDVSFIGSKQMGAAQGFRQANSLRVEKTISRDGGFLDIPNTEVSLTFPPDAFHDGRDQCLIQMRIIPRGKIPYTSTLFASNSTVTVELLPNNLRLKHPAKLTLPHCLHLKKDVEYKARIFMSHHEGNAEPEWEEIASEHQLDETKCTIWLHRFCWTKFEVDGKLVDGKRIKVYTAAKRIYLPDDIAEIELGYHLDIPGEEEMFRLNKQLILAQRRPYLFLKDGGHPLKVWLERIIPSTWSYLTPEKNPQEIPFRNVAAGIEYSCPFVLLQDKKGVDIPFCLFMTSQNRKFELELNIRPEVAMKMEDGTYAI